MPPVWYRHDAVLAHDIPGHPERPARIGALEARMQSEGWFGMERRDAPVAERAQLREVHPEEYVSFVERLCASGGGRIDPDTSAVAATWEAALRAAGGACALVDALVAGEARAGVCALRPPGHHAEPRRARGFCFFNNVAVAARHATVAHGLERVLILDWDVHHGNGTNDIFHADRDVLFVSIHEWPLYPGSGAATDTGSRDGQGFTVNLPVPAGTGDDAYQSLVEHVACTLIGAWEPELVLVSAGFDAHRDDPLARCEVTEHGFAGMTASLRRACDEIGAPLGLVLEGGYELHALSESMATLLPVLLDPATPPSPGVPVHPLAAEAARRLARWWPSVAARAGAA